MRRSAVWRTIDDQITTGRSILVAFDTTKRRARPQDIYMHENWTVCPYSRIAHWHHACVFDCINSMLLLLTIRNEILSLLTDGRSVTPRAFYARRKYANTYLVVNESEESGSREMCYPKNEIKMYYCYIKLLCQNTQYQSVISRFPFHYSSYTWQTFKIKKNLKILTSSACMLFNDANQMQPAKIASSTQTSFRFLLKSPAMEQSCYTQSSSSINFKSKRMISFPPRTVSSAQSASLRVHRLHV